MAAILDTMHASLIDLTDVVQCLCQKQDGYDYAACHNIIHEIYETIMENIYICISYIQQLRNMLPKHQALTTNCVLDPNVVTNTTTVLQDLTWTIRQIQQSINKFSGEQSYEEQVFMYNQSTKILKTLQCSALQFQTVTIPVLKEKFNTMQKMLHETKTNNQKLIMDKFHCNKLNTDINLKLVEMTKHVQKIETINTELTRVNKELTQQNIANREKCATIEDSNIVLRKKLLEASITNMRPSTDEHALRRVELPYTRKTDKKFTVQDR